MAKRLFDACLAFLVLGALVVLVLIGGLVISLLNGWEEPSAWFLKACLYVEPPWAMIFLSHPLWPAEVRSPS